MPYCINPNCKVRYSPDTTVTCLSCGSLLLIYGKYTLYKCIRTSEQNAFDFFRAKDTEGAHKFLKVLKNNTKRYKDLFRREAQILITLKRYSGFPKTEAGDFFEAEISESPWTLHCLAMEYIQGCDLEKWLSDQESISQERALEWLKKLTELLGYVHDNGFIHRDVKPANIMLNSDEQLILIDFNVARWELAPTQGGLVGTYGYMAPEQAHNSQAYPESDFFSLGRTFVYLLTGEHPNELINDQTAKLDWREKCRERQQMPEPLLDLIDSMMAESKEERPNSKEIIRRLAQIQSSQRQDELDNGNSSPQQSEEIQSSQRQDELDNGNSSPQHEQNVIETSPPFSLPNLFQSWFRLIRPSNRLIVVLFVFAIVLTTIIIPLFNSPSRAFSCDLPAPIVNAPNVNDMALSPDGKYLATVGSDNILRSLNVTNVNKIVQADCKLHGGDPNGDGIVALKFKPLNSTKNETILATGSLSSGAKLWNMNTDGSLSEVKDLPSDVPVVALAFSPQGSYLAIATSENDKKNDVKIYDMNKPNDVPKTIPFNQYIRDVSFNENGQYLAILRLDNTVEWWKLEDPKNVDSFTKTNFETNDIVALAYSPKGNYRGLATFRNTVEVPDFIKNKFIIAKTGKYIKSISFSQDEKYLANVELNNTAKVWERQSTQKKAPYEKHDVVALAFSPIKNSNVLAIDAKGKIEFKDLTKR